MGLKLKKILGISITTESRKSILEYVEKYLGKTSEKRKKPFVIVTPNPEQIVAAQDDPHFAENLNNADVAIPDGIGLALAMRLARIPGVEFMEDLVKLAAGRGYTIGLIGGRGNIAVEALECLTRKFSGLSGWAIEPEEKTIEEIIKKIEDSKTRLVFVGLGAPKQEYFIARLAHDMSFRPPSRNPEKKGWIPGQARDDKRIVFMSVGGSFDMIVGRTPRAPHAIGAFGLEWLWRLGREPWRWKRQVALLKFVWLVFGEKLKK
ncbi:MAG: WecB/TagA/CpsF family glycosyltransferase [Patescibacteria group bacterium]